MNLKLKGLLYFSTIILLIFFTIKILVLIEVIPSTQITRWTEFFCLIIFIPFFTVILHKFFKKSKDSHKLNKYIQKLNETLIEESHNEIFYGGDINESSKVLTKKISENICVDRVSVWLYNQDKTSIILQTLYEKKYDTWTNGLELLKKDFEPYFNHLEVDQIIIADDAETHTATSCFTENYLKPLGIKSMMDVPIIYRGNVIGVICNESYTQRKWIQTEIDFAQMVSSLYSMTYSIKDGNRKERRIIESEQFISKATIISITDKEGKIIFANPKFTEITGWNLEEIIGKDHNLVNSGHHSGDFWKEMYEVVQKGEVWNQVVVNKKKNGELYYVDSYIRARFDDDGNLEGYSSIRHDVTELKLKEQEIQNQIHAINKSNAVIEFDLDGKILFANSNFLEIMGYEYVKNGGLDEIVGKHHKIFVSNEVSQSKEYKKLWKDLKQGKFVSDIFERVRKDGKSVWLRATYNPIVDINGKVYKIMKLAVDVTESILQKREIEKKNTYLEHAAKILRHDMHSGINTYIPRGITSLERRLTKEDIERLKIEAPLKMIKEGLLHAQKVYKGVYEFTNLVKKDTQLNKTECNLKQILESYLSTTAYKSQVLIDELPTLDVNEALFCTAIDNLIRNGLKYNDSNNKFVKIFMENGLLIIQDNGRGLTQEEFEYLSKPYTRKAGQKESGTGLGLNICTAILNEHGFSVSCEKNDIGTKLKIKLV